MKIVSIIIPFFNAESTLSDCINSIINQTYSHLEIILLDDGSSDRSLAIAKKFETSDTRIVVLHHNNMGVSFTRNKGLDIATGKYVMFVDADDMIAPEWVERYVFAAEKTDADIAIGGITEIRPDGSRIIHVPPIQGIVGKEIWKFICESEDGLFGYVPNKIYKRELIESIRFDEHMTVQEDLSFAVDAYANASAFNLIDEAGYFYRFESWKRNPPFLDLIKNQLKIYSNSAPFIDMFSISLVNLVRLVIGWTFQFLYESEYDNKFYEKCIKVREIQAKYGFKSINKRHDEKTIVYWLLMRKRYRTIKAWFVLRRFIKRVLRRELYKT